MRVQTTFGFEGCPRTGGSSGGAREQPREDRPDDAVAQCRSNVILYWRFHWHDGV
jgi:hypothetical protein